MSNFMTRLMTLNRELVFLDTAHLDIIDQRIENPNDQLLQLEMDRYQQDVDSVRAAVEREYRELQRIATFN